MITDREFLEWADHPVTRALRKALEKKRDTIRRQWEGGSFTDYEREGTVITNVANMGTCRGYEWVQELDFETLIGELDDGEYKRPEAVGESGAD